MIGIHSVDDLMIQKRQVIERTTGTAVLNAEDPRCLAMRDHTSAEHIVLVAHNAAHPAITRHCEAGGTAIVIDPPGADGKLCICNSGGLESLLPLAEIPATCDGAALYNAENAMFAVAATIGLGLSREAIIAGLRNFSMSRVTAPGRLNIFEGLPFQVVVDYAHNAHGIKAFCEFSNRLAVQGRRILVFVVAGDKTVAEIEATAAAAANSFDYFLCRDPGDLRGRKPGAITALIKTSLMKNGVPGDHIEQFPNQATALERALEMVENGDLLVIFAGKFHTVAWNTLEQYRDALQHDCTVH